jgi:hypothetical protein
MLERSIRLSLRGEFVDESKVRVPTLSQRTRKDAADGVAPVSSYDRSVSTHAKRKCVHCLRVSKEVTDDHGFPSSWYPDTTPHTVQRWTAPSCEKCNHELGRLEKDMLIRVILCIDPRKEAVSGLATRVLRSLGLHVDGLTGNEKAFRDRLGAKLRAELLPSADVSVETVIPGLGPYENSPWMVPIPWASLSIITEKIVRVCEHKINARFVESPYAVSTAVDGARGVLPEPLRPFAKVFDFGPGFKVTRLHTIEDPMVVRYWMSIWDTLHLRAYIDTEEYLRDMDADSSRVQGVVPREDRSVMRISPYLRNMS